jgi:hypothetical protein
MDQGLGKVVVDTPVSLFIRIGQRASGDLTTDAHVIKLILHGT